MSATAAERMNATLVIMGASGYVRAYPHAMMAYSPQEGILYAVLDQEWYGEEYNQVVSADWLNICRAADAAGNTSELGWPGDNWAEDAVPGVELAAAETLSWRIEVPRAPWDYRESDRRLTPWSRELITHAISSGDRLWRDLWDELELEAL